MKLKNIFKLYKSYYPSAEPYRVTIAGCGAVQVSDSRCASRLCVGAAPGVHRFLSDRDEVVRTGSVLVVTTTAGGSSCLRLTPGGNLLTPDGNALLPTGRKGDDIARYTRLFHRDNAKWLADFADGKEDSL